MKTKFVMGLKLLGMAGVMALLTSCNDSDEPMGKGDVDFEITDAPTDDASVKSVFVTIADIKVDGKSVSGFTKQTIDIKAYQEGNTKVLANAKQLDAKGYNNIVLVLDLNADASGNAPGCYVQTTDDAKYKLKSTASGTSEVTINKSWDVAKNAKSTVVVDFDLRKAIAYSDDQAVRYSFVNDNNLSAAMRLVAKGKAGTISGTYQEDQASNADKIVVYAYAKGSFNQATETQAQGEDKVLFAKAITSATVKTSLTAKTYTVAMIEEGEYELYFAGYKTDPTTGRMKFNALLQSETTIDGSIGNLITVKAGATVNISTKIKGLL